MRSLGPILVVLAVLLAVWYVACIPMNINEVLTSAARDGAAVSPESSPERMATSRYVLVAKNLEHIGASWSVDRARLPSPEQVMGELWKGIFDQPITSKRSLVYHGMVTLQATLAGLALGLVVGIGLAMSIVYFRVMDLSVMPWAVISQTIPIVALAPMIVVLSNSLGLGDRLGIENRLVSKAIIAAYLSFFPVLVGMIKGLRSPDAMQIDLMRTWNATGIQEFLRLRLPASFPYLFASLKVAVAAALVGAIVGELPTGAIEGLGARMLVASQFGQPLLMWASLFAAAIAAGGLILVVGFLQRLVDSRLGVRP